MLRTCFYKDKLLAWVKKSPAERRTFVKLFLIQEKTPQMNALRKKPNWLKEANC